MNTALSGGSMFKDISETVGISVLIYNQSSFNRLYVKFTSAMQGMIAKLKPYNTATIHRCANLTLTLRKDSREI